MASDSPPGPAAPCNSSTRTAHRHSSTARTTSPTPTANASGPPEFLREKAGRGECF
jgi:hypothetical protein